MSDYIWETSPKGAKGLSRAGSLVSTRSRFALVSLLISTVFFFWTDDFSVHYRTSVPVFSSINVIYTDKTENKDNLFYDHFGFSKQSICRNRSFVRVGDYLSVNVGGCRLHTLVLAFGTDKHGPFAKS